MDWRHQVGVAVLGVAVAALIVAGTVLSQPPSTIAGPPFCCPPLWLGAATESTSGGTHWYNFTVTAAGPSVRLAELHASVANASGVAVDDYFLGLALHDSTGCGVALYGFATGTWAAPASDACAGMNPESPMHANEVLSLSSSLNLTARGYTFTCTGAPNDRGEYAGSVSVAIP